MLTWFIEEPKGINISTVLKGKGLHTSLLLSLCLRLEIVRSALPAELLGSSWSPYLLVLPAVTLLSGQPYVFPTATPKREDPNKTLEFRATG